MLRAAANALHASLSGVSLQSGESWTLQVRELPVAERVALARASEPIISDVLESGSRWVPGEYCTDAGAMGEDAPLAAAPLRTEGGTVFGCFWVGGGAEREWSSAKLAIFDSFIDALSRELGGDPVVSASLASRPQQEAAHFRALFETAPLGIVVGDFEAQHFETNPAYKEMFWWWSGNPFEDTVRYTHPEDLSVDAHLFQELISGARDHYRIEKRYVRPDGSFMWAELTLALVRDEDGDPEWFYSLVADISERKRLEEELTRASATDALTGLANRRGFFTLAERDLRLARRRGADLLLLYIDLDGFKAINDQFGHAEGDRLLRDVAELVRQCCRSTDVSARMGEAAGVVARMGGDEFVVLATDARPGAEEVIIERITQAVDRFNLEGGRPYALSLSIGASRHAPGDGEESVDDLLTRADHRMYEQKRLKADPSDLK